jgi:hypothetical protein
LKTQRLLFRCSCLLAGLLAGMGATRAQVATGRVVINEYMPWTLNACNQTAEFVELMNFGPGPMDIGCYILTDGDFSITIPPLTILQPGEFYVISGQNVLPAPCGNIDSAVSAQLNWNTCGCTSGPIPATGDGFFDDDGEEQVVLLNPALGVVDAVMRKNPADPSSSITTAALPGCTPRTFDLDHLNITYEIIGEALGRGNSYARVKDGDCGWVKDPKQSAHATNTRNGDVSDISYDFTIVQTMDCGGADGSIDIFVKRGSYEDIFPMNYTIVRDMNGNGDFDFNDRYTYGVDSVPENITVDGLELGHYRITVSSVKGCYLESFDFAILPCQPVLDGARSWFTYTGLQQQQYRFEWQVTDLETVQSLELERSTDGRRFERDWYTEIGPGERGSRQFRAGVRVSHHRFYRLKITGRNGQVRYLPVVQVHPSQEAGARLWPNPVRETVHLALPAGAGGRPYCILNAAGAVLRQGQLPAGTGERPVSLPAGSLAAGTYQLFLPAAKSAQPISLRFVKL